MKLIIAAMKSEVEELIKDEGFECILEKPFVVYKKSEHLLAISGIGKVNAGSCLGFCLTKFSIKEVYNVGFVGGKGFEQGSVCHIVKSIYHDFDLSMFGYEKGQVPNMPAYFIPSVIKGLGLKYATCYTGDAFMIDDLGKSEYVCDMELAGIMQVAYLFDMSVYSVKVVSDVIGSDDQLSNYNEFETNRGKYLYKAVKGFVGL